MFSYLGFLYQWVIKRLPRAFSIPLLILLILYFTLAFPVLAIKAVPLAEKWIGRKLPDISIPRPSFLGIDPNYSVVGGIVSALLIVLVAVLGVLVCYGIASLLYRIFRGKPMKRLKLHEPSPLSSAVDGTPDRRNPLAQYERIGIILAGGGAKGAYQAGAMQAIYEFLEKHQALHKVRMIAGTSIGAWNSLFWLGGLVRRPDANTRSVLEQWWHEVDVKSVIRFELYMPLRQNYLLSPQPWEETFSKIFKDNPGIRDRLLHHIQHVAPDGDHNECRDAMHFYLTRANIALGKLAFTTNRDDLSNIDPNLPVGVRPHQRATPDVWKAANSIDDLHDAVFASMDIPPLFKNAVIGDEVFEDGGVVDNLPIRFGTEFENCDLLFVLPLNASFAQAPDQRSIVKRLFRVMDVRQGVLERNSFKMIYLYNELAALRDAAQEQKALTTAAQPAEGEGSAIQRAVKRKHKMVQVFSICPAPELLINTAEFWKTAEAGKAFRLMYSTTKTELHQFFNRDKPSPDWIRMARVSPEGEVTYLTDF
jgi:predicted acylesterase/phospholipase RssA